MGVMHESSWTRSLAQRRPSFLPCASHRFLSAQSHTVLVVILLHVPSESLKLCPRALWEESSRRALVPGLSASAHLQVPHGSAHGVSGPRETLQVPLGPISLIYRGGPRTQEHSRCYTQSLVLLLLFAPAILLLLRISICRDFTVC